RSGRTRVRRRLLRRGPRAVGRRAQRHGRPALRRARLPDAGRRAGGVRRGRVHDARAPVGSADARGQRPVGLLPGAGAEDGDPERGARQDHVPARARSGARRRAGAGGAPPRVARAAGHAPVAFGRGPRLARGAHRCRSLRAPGGGPGAPRDLRRAADRRAHGRHGADRGAVPAPSAARHRLLFVLHRRRRLPRAERVFPRPPAARGARGVGAPLGHPGRGAGMTTGDGSPPEVTELAQAEARVEAHSADLKKELGVRDLALTQILFIPGLTWIGVAGKLGPSHVVFWLLAIVLFYLPTSVVVMYLNKLMPLEGGLYQWAKLGFNQTVGFMLAWNLWLYVI